MTDQKPAKPLQLIRCFDPTGRTVSCWGMVEDTDESRREHRAWHRHEEKVKQGLRDAIKARDEEIARLSREVGDAQRDVRELVIPEPVLGIEISRAGWTADDDDDEWGDETPQVSQYADEEQRATRADAEAAFGTADPEDYFTDQPSTR